MLYHKTQSYCVVFFLFLFFFFFNGLSFATESGQNNVKEKKRWFSSEKNFLLSIGTKWRRSRHMKKNRTQDSHRKMFCFFFQNWRMNIVLFFPIEFVNILTCVCPWIWGWFLLYVLIISIWFFFHLYSHIPLTIVSKSICYIYNLLGIYNSP